MSDDGLVASAVRIISCSTRNDPELGARAFRIWHERHDLDPSQCVAAAEHELYINSQSDDYNTSNNL
jgi:hypothetical protein